MVVKIVIVAFLVAILLSLASGYFFLIYKKTPSDKAMVNALTVRVALSVALFVLLLLAWYFGFIEPHPTTPG
jgi:ABC-type dipeptide/oligopeptide/nickel transport system permease component